MAIWMCGSSIIIALSMIIAHLDSRVVSERNDCHASELIPKQFLGR
jgi:hypothetical protein